MPISPRAFVKLPGLCMGKNVSQHRLPHLMCKCLNISVVANVHDLGNHPVWHCNRIVWSFPPDVFCGQISQCFIVDYDHGRNSSLALFKFDLCVPDFTLHHAARVPAANRAQRQRTGSRIESTTRKSYCAEALSAINDLRAICPFDIQPGALFKCSISPRAPVSHRSSTRSKPSAAP